MTAVYAPGTVAMVRCSDGVERRAFLGRRDGLDVWTFADDTYRYAHASEARPLVVLDLDDYLEDAEWGDFLDIFRQRAAMQPDSTALEWVADQIEAQTKPPKPVEPTGLGAVVEDAEGVQWVKIKAGRGTNWRQANAVTPGRFLPYADITVVRVLSEGVDQ